MNVSLQEAFDEACRQLGEAHVRIAVIERALRDFQDASAAPCCPPEPFAAEGVPLGERGAPIG